MLIILSPAVQNLTFIPGATDAEEPSDLRATLFLLCEHCAAAVHFICVPYSSNPVRAVMFGLAGAEAEAKVVQDVVQAQGRNV